MKDRTGQKLGYFYYEEEPDPAVIGQAAHEGRGPADRGQYRQVAGTAGPQLKPYMATDAARATRLASWLGAALFGDHPHKGIAKGIKI